MRQSSPLGSMRKLMVSDYLQWGRTHDRYKMQLRTQEALINGLNRRSRGESCGRTWPRRKESFRNFQPVFPSNTKTPNDLSLKAFLYLLSLWCGHPIWSFKWTATKRILRSFEPWELVVNDGILKGLTHIDPPTTRWPPPQNWFSPSLTLKLRLSLNNWKSGRYWGPDVF